MKFTAGLAGAAAALAFATFGVASDARAVTYDAFTSFDGTQGAGGFFYYSMPATGVVAPPTPLISPTTCVVTSDSCLQADGGLPGVYKSATTFQEGTYTVPNDQLLVHPGQSNPIGIFFVAPEAGDYDYTATFNVLDRSPSGVLLIGVTNEGGTASGVPLGALNATTTTLTATGTLSLLQGQFAAIIVGPNGSYANDSTGVNFTLTRAASGGAVPEPASWALMILGFGGAGAMLRRRAATALPA